MNRIFIRLFFAFLISGTVFAQKLQKIPVEFTDFATAKKSYGTKISVLPSDSSVKITKNSIEIAPSTEGVEYTISGYFNGQIVNKTKNTVLRLNNAYLENTSGKPVIFGEAKTEILTVRDTKNYIVSQGLGDPKSKTAAILCKKNLELGGTGTLYVAGRVYHAVKADDVKIKGDGELYFQGTKNGSCINCDNFLVEKDKNFKAYLINSKNAVKADYTILIQSGNFFLYDCDRVFKTDTNADDPNSPHSITLSGGTFYISEKELIYETEKNAYKAEGAVINYAK